MQINYFLKTVSADIDLVPKHILGSPTFIFIHFQDEGGFVPLHITNSIKENENYIFCNYNNKQFQNIFFHFKYKKYIY